MSIGPVELLLVAWIVMVLVAVRHLCGKLGWSHWLTLLVFIPLVGLGFVIVLAWEALPRAGCGRVLVSLVIIPVVSGLMLVWLAFRPWPELAQVPK